MTGDGRFRHIAAMPQGAPEYLGKYRLLQPLARGGMAELYLARQEGIAGFEKTVVIKRILPHLALYKDFTAMFLDEARIAAKLSHPNIVQYFDFGEEDGSYYIAMEYLAGEDLTAIVRAGRKRERRLPEALAAHILAAACDGLHYAHTLVDEAGRALNIVHRDISPGNLFITYQGAVKVLDFGIAKAEGKLSRTRTGLLKGKYLYMSPEQVRGDPLDGRSDVFALGAVLYEVLTDSPAFLRDSELDTLRAIMLEEVEPPRSKAPDMSEAMEAIILQALAPDLERRFRSALHMRKALEEYLASHATGVVAAQLQSYVRELMGDDRVAQRLRPETFAATRRRVVTPPSNPERSGPPLFEADSAVRAVQSEALLEAHGAVSPDDGRPGPPVDLRDEGDEGDRGARRAQASPDSTRKLRPSGRGPSERTTVPEGEAASGSELPGPSLSGVSTGPGARAPSSPHQAAPEPSRRRLALLAVLGALAAGFAGGTALLARQTGSAGPAQGKPAALVPPAEAADAAGGEPDACLPDVASPDAGMAASDAALRRVSGIARRAAGAGRAEPVPSHLGAPTSAPAPSGKHPRALLMITCSPACQIYLDSEDTHLMAPRKLYVDPGRHVVSAQNLATRQVLKKSVEVSPMETRLLPFDFNAGASDSSAP